MTFPNDADGDVLRQMAAHGFDFLRKHPVEFFAVFATPADAEAVARQYRADQAAGDPLERIVTRTFEGGGRELELARRMWVTHEGVTAFERKLGERIRPYGGQLGGWGVQAP